MGLSVKKQRLLIDAEVRRSGDIEPDGHSTLLFEAIERLIYSV